MKAQFTPGPWFYQENSDAYTHIVRAASTPNLILVHLRQDTSGVTEANARLIAAAPDLLNFAAFVVSGLESGAVKAKPVLGAIDEESDSIEMRSLAEIAREIIAKATGSAA